MNLPLKWHGGKYYLASKIVELMPSHLHYVEPFFGGGAVLLARDPEDDGLWLFPNKGVSEVVNDINGSLINFWRVLQRSETFEAFHRRLQATPMARQEWEDPHNHVDGDDAIANAVAFFVDCRQSRSGMMNTFTSVTRNRLRRKMNGNSSEWLSAVEGLPEVHRRLSRVLIEKMKALELIARGHTGDALLLRPALPPRNKNRTRCIHARNERIRASRPARDIAEVQGQSHAFRLSIHAL